MKRIMARRMWANRKEMLSGRQFMVLSRMSVGADLAVNPVAVIDILSPDVLIEQAANAINGDIVPLSKMERVDADAYRNTARDVLISLGIIARSKSKVNRSASNDALDQVPTRVGAIGNTLRARGLDQPVALKGTADTAKAARLAPLLAGAARALARRSSGSTGGGEQGKC